MIEEADRVAILSCVGTPIVDLLKIRCELGLLVAALGNVLLRTDHFPPRLEISGRAGLFSVSISADWGGSRFVGSGLRTGGIGGDDGSLEQLRSNGLHGAFLLRRVDPTEGIGYLVEARPCVLSVQVLRAGMGHMIASLGNHPQLVLDEPVLSELAREDIPPIPLDQRRKEVHVYGRRQVFPSLQLSDKGIGLVGRKRIFDGQFDGGSGYPFEAANQGRPHSVLVNVDCSGESVFVGSRRSAHSICALRRMSRAVTAIWPIKYVRYGKLGSRYHP